ncbi:2Fe-2S iron-sulfur cluster-binding protein [Saccharopolyspora sp. NPDC000359]|uniref:2Fe-2S iron-sulfur cluster-binding protein n=1 Tax=Saccharopolyspora sp. NPDC000359 TaxID=3154251 RepID=UPI0033343120
MPRIVFVRPEGESQEVEAAEGASAMRAALVGGVSGITADCGGEASCATCHVYVAEQWLDQVGGPGPDEDDMLDFAACQRQPNSRLSCQIRITDGLDGLVLTLPESQ